MNISPIIKFSYNSKLQKDNRLNFKNYQNSFNNSMTSVVKNKKDIETIFNNLVKTNDGSFILADWFKDLFIQFKNSTDPILQVLTHLSQKGAIATDSKNTMAYAQDKSVMFIGPKRDESIEFKLNKEGGVEFSRGDTFSTKIVKFYPNSNVMKSETRTYGDGLGQVTETVYYNKNGKKKPFRNFISDFFGI